MVGEVHVCIARGCSAFDEFFWDSGMIIPLADVVILFWDHDSLHGRVCLEHFRDGTGKESMMTCWRVCLFVLLGILNIG